MKVLITGGAGFIGSHVVDRLVERGDDVVVLDNLDEQIHGRTSVPLNLRGHVEEDAIRFVRGDIRDEEAVDSALLGVEAVVHLAAAVGVGQSMYHPCHYTDVNVAGQGRLMEALAHRRDAAGKFIVASSMSIYGEGAYLCAEDGPVYPTHRPESQLAAGEWEVRCPECGRAVGPIPTDERKPPQHASVYAVTKKAQEELALCFGAAYGIPTIALRFFNVYGSRQALSNPYTGVAAIFMGRLKNGRPPVVFEDGEQARDLIHVHDVVESVVRALDADDDVSGAFNVCTGGATTIRGVAEVLADRLDADIAPQILGRYRAGDIRHCIGDPTLARDRLGFDARISFEDGIDELLEWSDGAEATDRVDLAVDELQKKGLVV